MATVDNKRTMCSTLLLVVLGALLASAPCHGGSTAQSPKLKSVATATACVVGPAALFTYTYKPTCRNGARPGPSGLCPDNSPPTRCPATHPHLLKGYCFHATAPCGPGSLLFTAEGAPWCSVAPATCPYTTYFKIIAAADGSFSSYCSAQDVPSASDLASMPLCPPPAPPSPPDQRRSLPPAATTARAPPPPRRSSPPSSSPPPVCNAGVATMYTKMELPACSGSATTPEPGTFCADGKPPTTCPASHAFLIGPYCFPSAAPCSPGALHFAGASSPWCTANATQCPPGHSFLVASRGDSFVGFCLEPNSAIALDLPQQVPSCPPARSQPPISAARLPPPPRTATKAPPASPPGAPPCVAGAASPVTNTMLPACSDGNVPAQGTMCPDSSAPALCPPKHPHLINSYCFNSSTPCSPGALHFTMGVSPWCTANATQCPPGTSFVVVNNGTAQVGVCTQAGTVLNGVPKVAMCPSASRPPQPPAGSTTPRAPPKPVSSGQMCSLGNVSLLTGYASPTACSDGVIYTQPCPDGGPATSCPSHAPVTINGLCFISQQPCSISSQLQWSGATPHCAPSSCPPGQAFYSITSTTSGTGLLGYCSSSGGQSIEAVIGSRPCPRLHSPPPPPPRDVIHINRPPPRDIIGQVPLALRRPPPPANVIHINRPPPKSVIGQVPLALRPKAPPPPPKRGFNVPIILRRPRPPPRTPPGATPSNRAAAQAGPQPVHCRASSKAQVHKATCPGAPQPCPISQASCPDGFTPQLAKAMQTLCVRCPGGWPWDAPSGQCILQQCPAGMQLRQGPSEDGAGSTYYCARAGGGALADGVVRADVEPHQPWALPACSAE